MHHRAICVLMFVIVTVTGCALFGGCATTNPNRTVGQTDECRPLTVVQYTTGEARDLDHAVDKFVADDLERRGVITASQPAFESQSEFEPALVHRVCGYGTTPRADTLYLKLMEQEEYLCAALLARDYKLVSLLGTNLPIDAAKHAHAWYLSPKCPKHFGIQPNQTGRLETHCTGMAKRVAREFDLTQSNWVEEANPI